MFTPNEYYWFDLKHNDYREYISDFERVRSRSINGPYKFLLDNKLVFEELFGRYIKIPTVYAWASNGMLYGRNGFTVNNDNVLDFIRTNGSAVLKWVRGAAGRGTYIIHFDNAFYVNGEPMAEETVQALFSAYGEAILCEYVRQSSFEDELYPFATNTLRIICAKKKGERTARIIKAVQRIGNEESRPVDNVSAGAIACEIDLETGVLDSGVIAKAHHKLDGPKFLEFHPDTGAQLKGRVIPNWQAVKQQIEDLTNAFPYLNFVAWDVLLTDEGICVIEGNASAGVMMFQVRRGVRSEELGEIYRSYGVIE